MSKPRHQAPQAPVRRLLRTARHRTVNLLRSTDHAPDGLSQTTAGLSDWIAQKRSPLPPHFLDRDLLESVSRQHARAVYLGNETVLCRVLGKYLMYADSQETGITPHLAMGGCWESWISVVLARTLRRGWYCLDVGANHGYYTLMMADAVGRQGRILPVEPTPRLAELLRETLDVNGFPDVAIAQDAVWDTDGEMLQLVIPARRSLNAHLSQEAASTDSVAQVKSVTLDALTHEWPRVDLIKIDVEGAEENVWQGMTETIARNPGLILILEVNVARYEDARDFLRRIEAAGFRLRYIDIDAEVKNVTIDELLRRQVGDDWLLYLARR
jgi:FkbM family methyltransferase